MIYIINMDRSFRRRRFMVSELTKFQIHHEFVTAVDGTSLSPQQLIEVNDRLVFQHPMRAQEVAVIESHARALRLFANQTEFEFGLLLEDDVFLGSHLEKVLSTLSRVQNPNEISLLYTQVCEPYDLTSLIPLIGGFELCRPSPLTSVWGAQAYFLSRMTAARLSKFMSDFTCRADDWGHYVRSGVLDSVNVVFPFPVLHAEFDSEIWNASSSQRPHVLNWINKFVYRSRVFPLYHMAMARRRAHAEARRRRLLTLDGAIVKRTYLL